MPNANANYDKDQLHIKKDDILVCVADKIAFIRSASNARSKLAQYEDLLITEREEIGLGLILKEIDEDLLQAINLE